MAVPCESPPRNSLGHLQSHSDLGPLFEAFIGNHICSFQNEKGQPWLRSAQWMGWMASFKAHTTLFERDKAVLRNDQMVQNVNIQEFACLEDRPRDGHIIREGRTIS
jgi:hypothetical protein